MRKLSDLQSFARPTEWESVQPGIDIRTWLAGQALMGISSNSGMGYFQEKPGWQDQVAWAAVSVADAVIRELTKDKNKE